MNHKKTVRIFHKKKSLQITRRINNLDLELLPNHKDQLFNKESPNWGLYTFIYTYICECIQTYIYTHMYKSYVAITRFNDDISRFKITIPIRKINEKYVYWTLPKTIIRNSYLYLRVGKPVFLKMNIIKQ